MLHTPDNAIELAGRHIFWTDRTADDSNKTRCGGLCIYINKAWCTNTVTVRRPCSAKVEFLTVQIFLFAKGLYFHHYNRNLYTPDANAKLAINKLYTAMSKLQSAHAEAALIIAGDFNHANLKTALPKFQQHVSCNTRGNKTLDHVYTNIAAVPPPPPPGTVRPLLSVPHPQIPTIYSRCEAISNNHQGVARGDSLHTSGFNKRTGVCLPNRPLVAFTQILTLTPPLNTSKHKHHHLQFYHKETHHHIPKSQAMDEQGSKAPAEGPQHRLQIR